jgi:translation initiation factor 2 subunit 3
MAQQQSTAAPPEEVQRRIPKQPECNIGTSGHVDHGKCLTPDQYVIFGGRLVTGKTILETLESRGKLVAKLDGGQLYELSENDVVSISNNLQPTKAKAMLYTEHYHGAVFKITTDSGRSLKVTPEHPLLANRAGALRWIKARDLSGGDYVAFLSTVPQFAEPRFADPLPILSQFYRVVSYSEYDHLRGVTNGFTSYVALSPRELGQIRVLTKTPMRRLSLLARMDQSDLRRVLDGEVRSSARTTSKIMDALSHLRVERLRPGQFVAETRRRGRWSCSVVRDVALTDDLMKWFAFVWAEGTSVPSRIAISQTVQMGMLSEFLDITRREFGKEFKKVSDLDYHLSSKAIVDLLTAKYDFKTGNESVSSIAEWVLGAPNALRATFLRWFFTLDGEFNANSGQVMISQANEKNIVVLAYMLQSFGIVPRFSETKHRTQNGWKLYSRMMISGRQNLQRFAEIVGFEDPKIQGKLDAYLSRIDNVSKETDFSLPIDPSQLERLLITSGLLREGFSLPAVLTAKESDWYHAYSTSRSTGRLSRTKLLAILEASRASLQQTEVSLSELDSSPAELREKMLRVGLSLEQAAQELGTTRKVLTASLRKNDPQHVERLMKLIGDFAKVRISEAESLYEQFKLVASSPLVFDQVRRVEIDQYEGPIFDLTVPGYANFIAGRGAIVAHNTSVVQAITGVWASAHSEELKRGITIKVGYADAAFYKCPETPPPESYSTSAVCPVCGKETKLLRAVSFVDCPGHESLMTNMLAGAALMDGVILVIAANEPVPMPQTREHLLALQMLGMKKMVVVQNKIDRVDADGARKNYEAIKQFLANTVGADAPVIPVSAQNRINIDALIESIEETIPTPHHDLNATPQMYVLRSFDVNRPGVDVKTLVGGVLGGSLVNGQLSIGDEIEISPGIADEKTGKYIPIITKVASLGTGAGMTDKVGPGGLIALGTALDPRLTKGDVLVGNLVGKPGHLPQMRTHITVDLQLFDQAVGSAALIKVDKVKATEILRLNLGTASTLGTVTSARDAVAELDLKKPVVTDENGRVAISRRIAERWRLIGSGLVH